jgi:hypothetical protein
MPMNEWVKRKETEQTNAMLNNNESERMTEQIHVYAV